MKNRDPEVWGYLNQICRINRSDIKWIIGIEIFNTLAFFLAFGKSWWPVILVGTSLASIIVCLSIAYFLLKRVAYRLIMRSLVESETDLAS